ncbi:hypothetical protein BDY19DRAFT_911670 [Irpex rosettiformis]|uniref:Uncharacterized protein n=1 Tax=Irpex rosettiformis TaxID=378272 RepID=A0ACB8UKG3_9APHY|nr:hypothetical protein BDY19DRAFT_911670 [Irpex rosettiformis]
MSFQHFRLDHGQLAQPSQPQPPPPTVVSQSRSSLSQALGHNLPTASSSQVHHVSQHQSASLGQPPLAGLVLDVSNSTNIDGTGSNGVASTLHIQHVENDGTMKKAPYGSGEPDDGYTLVFASMATFNEWRKREEEERVVEFVKGDTHGSKAIPPRFKEHTKLVCARHTRSGRKKYVKKFPERVRKVPSRKIEGQGCPASISYKTYFETEEVRVSYVSEHSHEIGPANLPYTKRGRRAQVLSEHIQHNGHSSDGRESTEDPEDSPPIPSQNNPIPGPSNSASPILQHPQAEPALNHLTPPQSFDNIIALYPSPPLASPTPQQQQHSLPLPQPQMQHHAQLPPPVPPPPPSPITQMALNQERWDRMSAIFESVRGHARTFDYPSPSVATLETILIRLYLESPVNLYS